MAVAYKAALLLSVLALCQANMFLHNPRGSNNRNCGSQGANRINGRRLFNSGGNNARGGYSCPRAFPFPCYKHVFDATARGDCNQHNQPGDKNMIDHKGEFILDNVVRPAGSSVTELPTNTGTMYYYENSVLPIQWTALHGSGQNENLLSNIVLQYACDDTLTDSCGDEPTGNGFPFGKVSDKECFLRDGYPVNNDNGNSLNGQATSTIPENAEDQDDNRYGRHETLEYYRQCQFRSRNRGLWTADRGLGNTATHTRQNNGARYGLECPEERDYYPYWHWTPWKDIVNIVSEKECNTPLINCPRCRITKKESQNKKEKHRCVGCPNCRSFGGQPVTPQACSEEGGSWVADRSHNIDKPDCIRADFETIENSLSNSVTGENPVYNWTIPKLPSGVDSMRCVLRARYNITPGDYGEQALDGTANSENKVFDDSNEEATYLNLDAGSEGNIPLAINVNSNAWGKVYQDRSYVFEIRKRPITLTGTPNSVIHNLNVRGKRGNIVQTFPAVEYDFVPSHLTCVTGESVHVQWTGSDYNPNRNGNNGEGGPVDPVNMGNTLRTDRSNLVQMAGPGDNHPLPTLERSFIDQEYTRFDVERFFDKEATELMSFLGQDPATCTQIEELRQLFPNDQDARERYYSNCGKLNTRTPYFDGGVHRCSKIGIFHFMSTRNNNFSNRDVKTFIEVKRNFRALIIALSCVLVAGMAFGAYVYRRKKQGKPVSFRPKILPSAFANPLRKKKKAEAVAMTAIYNYEAKEANELSFEKGDTVVVTGYPSEDWWMGTSKGNEGVFPRTYVA
mmetsp:Transcript_3376/g.3774  ORF Transcript_3376/g.3774 Transcript_3376/m.3774 type:complete len:792 (-) Transcript_3376:168-2543(-)